MLIVFTFYLVFFQYEFEIEVHCKYFKNLVFYFLAYLYNYVHIYAISKLFIENYSKTINH